MEVVTLSSKGQIVIPAKVRKKFSLKEGDSLVLVEENDAIRLQPLVNLSELWSIDELEDPGAMLKEVREEWDDDPRKESCSSTRTRSLHSSAAKPDRKVSKNILTRSRPEMPKDSLQRSR
jgi:AbrB family looped-hinge helix DNA binding protein